MAGAFIETRPTCVFAYNLETRARVTGTAVQFPPAAHVALLVLLVHPKGSNNHVPQRLQIKMTSGSSGVCLRGTFEKVLILETGFRGSILTKFSEKISGSFWYLLLRLKEK